MLDQIHVYLGDGDMKDAFHRFRLRREFSEWLCVGHVLAEEVGMVGEEADGVLLKRGDPVDLCWTSSPMGFSWSLFFCQYIISDVAETALAYHKALSCVIVIHRLCFMSVALAWRITSMWRTWAWQPGTETRSSEVHSALWSGWRPKFLPPMRWWLSSSALHLAPCRESSSAIFCGPRRFWRITQAVRFAFSRRAVPG